MGKVRLAILLAITLTCTTIFLGCATIPREELEEKDAIIQNLNAQIEDLKQEIIELRHSNEELIGIKSELEQTLREKEKAMLEKSVEERSESKIK